MSNSPKIFINGKSYEGLEQVPEELRKMLQDQDQNGVPDLLEGKFSFGDLKNIITYAWNQPGAIQVQHQGQTLSSLDQLPPEARAKVQAAMTRLQSTDSPVISTSELTTQAPNYAPALSQPKTSGGAWVFLMIIIGLLLSLAIAGWFVYSYLATRT